MLRRLSKLVPFEKKEAITIDSLDELDVHPPLGSSRTSLNEPETVAIETREPTNESTTVTTTTRKQSLLARSIGALSARSRTLTASARMVFPQSEDRLQKLPLEIIFEIMDMVITWDPSSTMDDRISNLRNLSLTSKKLREICTHERYWKPLYLSIASSWSQQTFFEKNKDMEPSELVPLYRSAVLQQMYERSPYWKRSIQFINQSEEHTYKVLVVASEGNVGESNLVLKFVRNIFIDHWEPRIEDVEFRSFEVDGQQARLEMVVPATQEEYSALREYDVIVLLLTRQSRSWCRDVQGIILVFSCTRRSSLEDLPQWLEMCSRVQDRDISEIPKVLVCNKVDLDKSEWQILDNEGKELAAMWRCPYFETSAKTGMNVDKPFAEIVRQIRQWKAERIAERQTMVKLSFNQVIDLPK